MLTTRTDALPVTTARSGTLRDVARHARAAGPALGARVGSAIDVRAPRITNARAAIRSCTCAVVSLFGTGASRPAFVVATKIGAALSVARAVRVQPLLRAPARRRLLTGSDGVTVLLVRLERTAGDLDRLPLVADRLLPLLLVHFFLPPPFLPRPFLASVSASAKMAARPSAVSARSVRRRVGVACRARARVSKRSASTGRLLRASERSAMRAPCARDRCGVATTPQTRRTHITHGANSQDSP